MNRDSVFTKVRAQALIVRKLRREADGAPTDAKEFCQARLKKEEVLLRVCEAAVRKKMEAMKPEHYAFAALYYIGGFSLKESAEAIDRSARQCMRYKKEIECNGQGLLQGVQ